MMERLVASPVCEPALSLEESLAAYAAMGFTKFEAFTGWVASALRADGDADDYLEVARRHGMRYVSVHLPQVSRDDPATLEAAVEAARLADALEADVVLYKAATRRDYVEAAPAFLAATGDLDVTPVVQNHAGTALESPEDVREVLEGIADPRVMGLLEVGHFHQAGFTWRDGAEALGDRIALVHVKDMDGPEPVPFGRGEVDFPALFGHMREVGYEGDYVVELEGWAREQDPMRYVREGAEYLCRLMEQAAE